jgi:hypothetical protein
MLRRPGTSAVQQMRLGTNGWFGGFVQRKMYNKASRDLDAMMYGGIVVESSFRQGG